MACLAVLLVIAIHLDYLWTVRTDVPHQDDWSLLDGMFKSLDEGTMLRSLLTSRNGHFPFSTELGYLVSLKLFGLDLGPLRLFNFAICLAAFLLTNRVIRNEVASIHLRALLNLGAALVIFNLSMWEHFSVAGGFAPLLGAFAAGAGLYCAATVLKAPLKHPGRAAIAVVLLTLAVLSFGIGYAGVAAAVALVVLYTVRRAIAARFITPFTAIWVIAAVAILALAALSHPNFGLTHGGPRFFYRLLLVAGSIWAIPFDSAPMGLNSAFLCGMIVLVLCAWVASDFMLRRDAREGVLPPFAVALVLFGLAACAAVSLARVELPLTELVSSRYTLQASIGLLGVLLYAVRLRTTILPNIWCVIAAGYCFAMVEERQVGPYRGVVYKSIADAMLNIDQMSDQQLRTTLYFQENTAGVRRVVARMRRDRLNLFQHE